MWVVIGTLAIVAATVSAGLLIERRFGFRHRQLAAPDRDPPHAAGAAPATAICGGDLAVLRRQTCCAVAMDALPDDRVRYNDGELLVLRFACARCPATRRIYVDRR